MMDIGTVPTLQTIQGNGQLPDLTDLPEDFAYFLRSVRRYLHMRPEVGFQERETSQFLQDQLESHGLEVIGPLAQTGLYVDIMGAHPGPAIGYRCDMDALPIHDAKQVPYASRRPGVSHLCGHDAHMTVALGIAILLHQLRDDLRGTVRVFFQPNEEGSPSGSVPMIRDGVLEGLTALYCIHVDPTLDVGIFGLPQGRVTAASDRFRVRICAPSTGHSARPHQTKDTIWVATHLLSQFYQLVGRVTDARHSSILTVCIFKGGDAHNVIPSEVVFEGTLRCLDEDDRLFLKQYMRRTAEHFAALHDLTIALDFSSGMPSVVNDARLLENARQCITTLFGERAALDIAVPSMGSEDFSNYLDYVPGALLRVGTRSGRQTSFPLHDAHFDIDEASLQPTVQLMTSVLLKHLH